MMKKCQHSHRQQGMVVFSVVIVLAVVLAAVSISATLLSIGEAQVGHALYKGTDKMALVEGCAEDYLGIIRLNPGYAGGTISRPEGVCAITIVSPDPNWDIVVLTTGLAYQRSVQITFTRSATGITLLRWKEVP